MSTITNGASRTRLDRPRRTPSLEPIGRRGRRGRAGRLLALASMSLVSALSAVVLSGPEPAAASTTVIAASLSSVTTDAILRCFVQSTADSHDEFYGPGSCGTMVRVNGALYGFRANALSPLAAGTTGSGTSADPYQIVTQVGAAPGVTVFQTDTWVVGQSGFQTTVDVLNQTGAPAAIDVYRTGDCYVAGSDVGLGALTSTGVACLNYDGTRALTWTPLTLGNVSRVEAHYGTNYALVDAGGALPNTCVCDTPVDNGMSLRWSATVPSGETFRTSSRLDLSLYDDGGSIFDSDGDGLPDAWEAASSLDEQGNPTYDLRAMGADPRRADLFVVVEAERDAPLSAEVRAALVAAYANAPRPNPDGSTGITLHLVDGPTLSAAASDGLRGADGSPDWPKIWSHWLGWAPHGPSVFHLAVQVAWDSFDYGGEAPIPGQMLVTNTCGRRSSTRTVCKGGTSVVAGTFMHELGHNLNLRHGGGDDINFKPNYPSIMNYTFQNSGVPGIGLDYSRYGDGTFYPLDEGRLVEGDGLLLKPGASMPAGFTSYRRCPGSSLAKPIGVNQPVDWNCKRKIEAGYVRANINGLTMHADGSSAEDIEVLNPFDDWSHIVLADNHSNVGFAHVEYRVGDATSQY